MLGIESVVWGKRSRGNRREWVEDVRRKKIRKRKRNRRKKRKKNKIRKRKKERRKDANRQQQADKITSQTTEQHLISNLNDNISHSILYQWKSNKINKPSFPPRHIRRLPTEYARALSSGQPQRRLQIECTLMSYLSHYFVCLQMISLLLLPDPSP